MSDTPLEAKEVPAAHRGCQSLTKGNNQGDSLQSHQKQVCKVQSKGIKYFHHEILTPSKAIQKTLIAFREKGNNSSVCSAGREGTLPGVQPAIGPVINTL